MLVIMMKEIKRLEKKRGFGEKGQVAMGGWVCFMGKNGQK